MKMKMVFQVLSWYKNVTFQCGYRIVSLVLQLSHTLDMYKLINTIKFSENYVVVTGSHSIYLKI